MFACLRPEQTILGLIREDNDDDDDDDEFAMCTENIYSWRRPISPTDIRIVEEAFHNRKGMM